MDDVTIGSEISESQGSVSQNISEMKFSVSGKKKKSVTTRTLLELLEVR